jgi:small subunit ribosomal protein S8
MILLQEGYVKDVAKVDTMGKPALKIVLKYDLAGASIIHDLKRISKPGRRVYASIKELPHVLNNFGIAVISTSQGLMTNKKARQKKLGGEIICEVY